MINWLSNYWYNYQLKLAISQGKYSKAKRLLKQVSESGKLSCLASLYQQQLKSNNLLAHYQQELEILRHHLQEITPNDYFLKPQSEFINYIYQCFKLNEIDSNLMQATGVEELFFDLEIALVEFITTELNKVPEHIRDRELTEAFNDLTGLKQGIDPAYSCRLTSHVYLIKYFLDNVYCLYLAWFLIYQQGLLRKNIKILDLAAGVNTSIFSLALLSSNLSKFSMVSLEQVNYYSLEQQADLQYRGLQFWRKYIESFTTPLNTYFRFNTADLFNYQYYSSRIPKSFFDFIIISHCFFYEPELRERANQIYQQIFQDNLSPDGRVLLIIQGKKLFNAFNISMTNDLNREKEVIQMFIAELGLKLDWYKYLSSTEKRLGNKKQFHQFAKTTLPLQKHISRISQIYFLQNYTSHYAIDDYVILAQPLKTNKS